MIFLDECDALIGKSDAETTTTTKNTNAIIHRQHVANTLALTYVGSDKKSMASCHG
jgi:hypothetical protein